VTRKIITDWVYPPSHYRGNDWCAYRDGDEETASAYGWGATEDEAIAALLELEAEHEDAPSSTDTLRSLFTPFGGKE